MGRAAERVGDDDDDQDDEVGFGPRGSMKHEARGSARGGSKELIRIQSVRQCDKVKSLFEGRADNHGNNLIGMKAQREGRGRLRMRTTLKQGLANSLSWQII